MYKTMAKMLRQQLLHSTHLIHNYQGLAKLKHSTQKSYEHHKIYATKGTELLDPNFGQTL